MGKITYTKSQETAIRHRGGNLLLSAAAGSGKTATLTARILRLLLEGDENGEVNLTDMLVVTYTRAAANELRGRISSAIVEAEREWRVGEGDESRPVISRNRFFRHITDVQRADISTIHSFLYKVLRPYFPALGLAPDMSIIDESAANVLKAAAMQDVIDDYFDKPGEASEEKASFTELADAFGAARDAAALDAVFIDMADSLVSVGRDEGCLYDYADVLSADAERGFFKSVYGEYIKDHIRLMLCHYRMVFSDIADDLFGEGGKAAEKYGPALSDILEVIKRGEAQADEGDYSAVREIIAGYTPVKLGTLTAKDKTETAEYFKTVRERFKKDMSSLAEDYFMADEGSLTLSMRRTARILRMLGDVLGAYYKAFAGRKRAQNALDYSDLELYALKLFIDENGDPTDVAKEVGERYKYIFIDEYQDTNHVQDDIFRAISGNSVRFMVGDIKQSIYRFRGAEPEVFSGYRDRWSVLRPEEEAEEGFSHDGGRCVFMSENFRCDEPVVKFVNMISGYMFPHGGIPYTEDDELICGKGASDKPQSPVEICLIEKPRRKKSDEDEDGEPWDDSFNPEAEYTADRIASMIGEYLIDGERPCRASDIAIITRNMKGTAEVYGEALMRRGIQVRLKTNVTPLTAKSAKLVMCILNLVDNPMREIYAAGAMRSPVFGFTTDDIVALKHFGGELPLYMAAVRAAFRADPSADLGYAYSVQTDEGEVDAAETEGEGMISPDLLEKCLRLAEWVKRHKSAARGMKADKYLEFLYGELELSSFPEVFEDAAERTALNRLYESARRFEGGRFGGLSGFIDYLNENADTETAEVGEENAVSIVSIHSAKGLEYPVCFLVECGKERNKADERKNLLFDPTLGFGMTLPDEGGLVRCDTAVRCGIAEKMRADAINEEMRILYVALTRARSRLIVTAKTADADALLMRAQRDKDYFTEWSVRECTCYRDMIINGAARMGERDFYETKVIPIGDITPFIPEEAAEKETAAETEETSEEVTVFDFEKNFNFRYSLDFLSKIPSKLSVSGLGPNILDDEENSETVTLSFDKSVESTEADAEPNIPLPVFMTGVTEVKGTDRGTATHLFMQFMDLGRLAADGVDAEIDRLVRDRFISAATAEMVDRADLKRFAESDLFRRMLGADMIKREFRFNVRMPAEKFTEDEELRLNLSRNDVKVTVQGVVDCVFRGERGLVLVDYKTDSMSREEYAEPLLGEEKLIRRHRAQLMYYKEICERLFDEEMAETVIYSTTLARTIAL
ncbi:MAG: hypothetical protein E7638_01990 [Ruminococcaceae bacterium]|nr:hypothetical protein [Oscillospiraceae bacterium]